MEHKGHNQAFTVASLVMGILAIVTFCTVYLPPIFASLGILFAILSRDEHNTFPSTSIASIVLSVIALVWTVIIVVIAVFVFTTMTSDQYPSEYQEIWEWYQDYFEESNDTSI